MRLVTCTMLWLAAVVSYADTPVPAVNCNAPERPKGDVPQTAWMQYTAQVDNFRVCISSYVERNQAASDAHRAAANQATLMWNEFVRSSLNAPADYGTMGGTSDGPAAGSE